MEEVDGKLAPALDFLTRHIRNDLFGSRLDHEVAHVAVLDAQKLRTVLFPAAGFLPEFRRLNHRHQELNRPRANHFLADDFLDLADHAQTEGHVGIDARGKLLDHAGADHVLLADDVGISGGFFETRNKE